MWIKDYVGDDNINGTTRFGPLPPPSPTTGQDQTFAFNSTVSLRMIGDSAEGGLIPSLPPGNTYTLAGQTHSHFGCYVPALDNHAEIDAWIVGTAFQVVVEPPPVITSISPTSVVTGASQVYTIQGTGLGSSGSVTFTPTSTGTTPLSVSYSNGNGTTVTTPSVTLQTADTYDVALAVTAENDNMTFSYQSQQGRKEQSGSTKVTARNLTISIDSIWSDQFPGVSVNGLPVIPGVRGAGEKPPTF